MYVLAQGTLYRVDHPFTATSGNTQIGDIDTSAEFRSLATDGTNLFAYDRVDEAIYLVEISGNNLVSNVYVSVTFPAAVTNPNVLAMFYFDGAFYFVETSQDAFYRLADSFTVGGTAAATRVGNVNRFGANIGAPHGAGVFDGEAYMLDAGTRTLYRFYNVRWDDTIDVIEIDAGASGTFDLTTVSKDAASFEFAPSNTARSWITLSTNDLTLTTAPDVTADTDFDVVVRALRDGVFEDETLTVRVIAPPPPPMITAPLSLPNFRVTGKGATWIEVAWDQGDDGGASITDHEVSIEEGDQPGTTWDSTGSTSRTHRFNNLKKGTEYTTQGRGVNSEGEGDASAPVTTTTDTTIPGAPTNQRITPGTGNQATTAEVEVDPPEDTGGLPITQYQSQHAEGTTIPGTVQWVNRGTSPIFTLPNLKKGTAHAAETRAVNSDGEGASTGITTFTTNATAPDPPTLNLDTIGIREAEFSVQDGDDGGSAITERQFRIVEGNTPGGRWQAIDSLTFVVSNLQHSTQYTAQAQTLNDEGESQPSNAVTFTTQVYVPTPPVWQTGTALRRTINAGETATVDIGALVPNADRVEEIFGLQFHWMEYNEATKILTLEDAPILREDTDIKIRFIATNDDGETPADYIITLKGSVLASLHNMLFFEEPLNFELGRITRHGTTTIVPENSQITKTKRDVHHTHRFRYKHRRRERGSHRL